MSDWRVEEKYIDYFVCDQTSEELNEKCIVYGQDYFSINDIVCEMREGTDFGRKWYSLLEEEYCDEPL